MDFSKILKKYDRKDRDKLSNLLREQDKMIIYQVLTDIDNSVDIKKIIQRLESNNYGWKHEDYKTYQELLDEQDDFIENPFEVEEGVLQCRCGSKRVFSYSKQVRSGDEGFTTFAQCMACKSKWQHRG